VPQLTAVVITRNEAANIGDCLDSVAFCDERIVVDCGSSDGTVDIANATGARVEFREWRGFWPQKNYAPLHESLARDPRAENQPPPRSGEGEPREAGLSERAAGRESAAGTRSTLSIRSITAAAATSCMQACPYPQRLSRRR